MISHPPEVKQSSRIIWFLLIVVVTILISVVGAWAASQVKQDTKLQEQIDKEQVEINDLKIGYATLDVRLEEINKKLDIVIAQTKP